MVVDPKTIQSVLDLGIEQGSLDDLGVGTTAVSTRYADDHNLKVGDSVPVSYADGSSGQLRIVATFANRDVVGSDFTMSTDEWTPHANENFDSLVVVKLNSGVSLARGPARSRRGRCRLPERQGAGPAAVHRPGLRPGQPGPRPRLRDAGSGHHHRLDGHRQHAVAVDLRTHARARPAARRRRDPPAAAVDGPLGVGDHRVVRHDRRRRSRRAVRLGAGRRPRASRASRSSRCRSSR